MNKFVKRLLAFALSAMAVAGAAFALPGLMSAVMADTIGTTVVFEAPQAEENTDENPLLPPQATLVPIATTATPIALSPTAVPLEVLPTAVPEQADPAPIALTPAPTPMPEEDAASLPQAAPADWRALLPRGDTYSMMNRLPKGWQKVLGNISKEDMERYQVYALPQAVTLAESRLPRDLAQQKLLTGVLDNLNNNPIFAPRQDVLLDLMDLSFSAFTQGDRGELATLTATNRLLMPLRVLEFNAMNDRQMLPPEEYLESRRTLMDHARQEMARTDTPALGRSLDLVAQLMWDDKPWTLSVMDAAPYISQENWEFYCYGHHVKAVDMETGSVYTMTTDLESDRVIGIATEGAEPYLTTYGRLLDAMRQRKPLDPQAAAEASAYALKTLEGLAGISFSQQQDVWQVVQGSGGLVNAAGDEVKEYYDVQVRPTDAEARTLDKLGDHYRTYTINMDGDLNLLSYEARLVPATRSGEVTIQAQDDEMEQELQKWSTYYAKRNPQVRLALQYVHDNWRTLAAEQLTRDPLSRMGLSILQLETITVQRDDHPTSGKTTYFVLSETLAQDAQGRHYRLTLSTDEQQNTFLSSVQSE